MRLYTGGSVGRIGVRMAPSITSLSSIGKLRFMAPFLGGRRACCDAKTVGYYEYTVVLFLQGVHCRGNDLPQANAGF